MASENGKHSRHNKGDPSQRVDRSSKHRYVYFVGDKYQKRQLMNDLNYQILDYPKGQSVKYDAGEKVMSQNLLFI
jgi:hypothetical protein